LASERVAQINADHFARAPTGGEPRVPALAAAAFEHELVAEKVWRDGRDPLQKLLAVALVVLREVLPLPAEVGGGRGLLRLDLFSVRETRHAPPHGKRARASGARQLALDDLPPPARLVRLRDRRQAHFARARRASEECKQPLFHESRGQRSEVSYRHLLLTSDL
jgi:hypothetical protein